MSDGFNTPKSSKKSSERGFFSDRPVWWWLLGIFLLLLLIFLIVILVLVIVNLTRENNLQSQMQPGVLLHTLRKGIDSFMGNDIILNNKLSFCFSKTYKLNSDNTPRDTSDTLHNYFKNKYIEITDPSDYIYNNQDKVFINKGRIDIYYKDPEGDKDEEGEVEENKHKVIYSISTNLPYFSAIKLIHMNIEPNDQTFSIKHRYNLCTNEIKDETRKCHKGVGKHIHTYNNTFNDNIIRTDFYSTIHVLVFFVNENDALNNKQHKNSIGDIAFILNLDKC